MLIFVFIFFKSAILVFLFFNWDILSHTFKKYFNNTKDFNSSKNDKIKICKKLTTTYTK